jgi:hypothetical protein
MRLCSKNPLHFSGFFGRVALGCSQNVFFECRAGRDAIVEGGLCKPQTSLTAPFSRGSVRHVLI